MGRAPCCEKTGLKKGPWSPQEDQILVSYIHNHGHSNWRALPKLAGLLRCGKSCRLRWINYLRPDIKRGNFSTEEEDTIIQLHQMLGNRWSMIAAKLPGRTDNEIKNVWHTYLKKRLPKPNSNPITSSATITTIINNKIKRKSTAKLTPKSKRKQRNTTSKESKLTHENYKNQIDDDEEDENNNNNDNITNDLTSSHPCTSERSIVTTSSSSISTTSASESGIKEEIVEDKDEYFVHDTEIINDDFWMEVLSIEENDTSSQDHRCITQYHPHTSVDTSVMEPIKFDSKVDVDDDVDIFWYNF